MWGQGDKFSLHGIEFFFFFKNINTVNYRVLNLDTLEEKFGDKGAVTKADLIASGFMKSSDLVKLCARGELTKKIEIEVDKATKAAKEAVEKAGGKVVELDTKIKKKEANTKKSERAEKIA